MRKVTVFYLVVVPGIALLILSGVPLYVPGIGVVLAGLFLLVMSMSPKAGFFMESVLHTAPGNVLLSFDDGPDPEHTVRILDILKKHGVTAMFFLIGQKIPGNEELVRRIAAEGHMIGSHSLNHSPWMGFYATESTRREILDGHAQLLAVVPEAGPWFRPPFGVGNPTIAKVLAQHRMQSVGWSVRSYDTVKKDPEKLLKKLSKSIKGSDIVLLHDTQSITAEVLEPLVLALKNKNLTLKATLK